MIASQSSGNSGQIPANSNMVPNDGFLADDSNEAWKAFIRSREPFNCLGRMDGFYASRWCNVFYRCFLGVKTEFFCPKMLNSDRLWWIQHNSPQETPQTSAACVWPCESKKKCQSPGGLIIEVGVGKYEESTSEVDRVWRASSCSSETNRLSDMFKLADNKGENSQQADSACMGVSEDQFFGSKYCNVFHRCTGGKRKDFQCPPATPTSTYQLWWNEEKGHCDWPCKIQCNKAVYGTSRSASDIQNEDRQLNIDECRMASKSDSKNFPYLMAAAAAAASGPSLATSPRMPQPQPQKMSNPIQTQQRHHQQQQQFHNQLQQQQQQQSSTRAYFTMPSETTTQSSSKSPQFPPIRDNFRAVASNGASASAILYEPAVSSEKIPLTNSLNSPSSSLPDENMVCRSVGLVSSLKYCNVYYNCKQYGHPPSDAFYCLDGSHFDQTRKQCRMPSVNQPGGQCALNPPLMYPYVSIPEIIPPEEFACSNQVGAYVIHSNVYCNIYYACDGRSTKPTAFRCYDRQNSQEAVFNRETRRCEAANKSTGSVCQGEMLPMKLRYQSTPIDHTKFGGELQPLSCRNDQQYLAEHDKYCNLYHSCILGKYQMYACITLGSFDKTSYFYYTNGDCAAPNPSQCGSQKSIYPYEKLFSNDNFQV